MLGTFGHVTYLAWNTLLVSTYLAKIWFFCLKHFEAFHKCFPREVPSRCPMSLHSSVMTNNIHQTEDFNRYVYVYLSYTVVKSLMVRIDLLFSTFEWIYVYSYWQIYIHPDFCNLAQMVCENRVSLHHSWVLDARDQEWSITVPSVLYGLKTGFRVLPDFFSLLWIFQ